MSVLTGVRYVILDAVHKVTNTHARAHMHAHVCMHDWYTAGPQ